MSSAWPWRTGLFLLTAAGTLLPLVSPALALALGVGLALTVGVPWADAVNRAAGLLLRASVVGLGFGLPLGALLAAGRTGAAYTALGVLLTLLAGWVLCRALGVDRPTGFLVTAGTSICGGSAIAATAPVIGAGARAVSVALATVFLLNGVALFLFPWLGTLLQLTQTQFAVWAAVAIHDTSSVVGAAATYGEEALRLATVLKLSRALWILPLVVATGWWVRRREAGAGAGGGGTVWAAVPWFIGLFVLASVVRTVAGAELLPLLEGSVWVARRTLVLTLFLIGAGLSRERLRETGWRPLLAGVLLWILVGGVSLAAVLAGIDA